jgi:hypothetical protein
MSHDLRQALDKYKNSDSLKLLGAKSISNRKGKSVSLTIKKYQVVAIKIHSGFL